MLGQRLYGEFLASPIVLNDWKVIGAAQGAPWPLATLLFLKDVIELSDA
jgi:hypothetical protein